VMTATLPCNLPAACCSIRWLPVRGLFRWWLFGLNGQK
jgi:hypothetical protein